MGLREEAEEDLGAILEDDVQGFGWPLTLTDPDGVSNAFVGSSTDISQIIDPETGMVISGRSASVTLRISSIYAAGLPLPAGIADTKGKPWVITLKDINGISYDFKVAKTDPDRALGAVVLLLEFYKKLPA